MKEIQSSPALVGKTPVGDINEGWGSGWKKLDSQEASAH